MSINVNTNQYKPDQEEIQDAVSFLANCSSGDLKESWTKISSEWDTDSLIQVHRSLCNTGRINALLEELSQS